MLVLLVLCAYLQTLNGAPLLPPHASSFVAAVDLLGRDSPVDPACGGPQCRTVKSIVRSCLLTIFACVWTSLHPNINGPMDSAWTCFKRKIVTMLCAAYAPDLVFLWALRQRWAATEIAKKYNENFAKSVETVRTKTPVSRWGKVVGWFLSLWWMIMDLFQPLSQETTRRGYGQAWTITHGFFIQMGGFILYDGEYPKEVLNYERLADLLRKQAIDAPTVTERNLRDRSKGDTVSKAIVVLQTMWFVLQCFARWGQRLPLSELEVLTLSFAAMTVVIYAAWWNKPQGVDTAICVPLKRKHNLSHAEPDRYPSNDNIPALIPLLERQPDVSTGEVHTWLRRMLRKDRKQYSSPVFFLFRLPYRIFVSVLRPVSKVAILDKSKKEDLRVSMFYTDFVEDGFNDGMFLLSCGIGMTFGAVHLLAWTSKFPSPRDALLWRISATVLTVPPLLAALQYAIRLLDIAVDLTSMTVLSLLLLPFYCVARFVVIIIALLAIRHPPADVLRDISWAWYIPHF